MSGWTTTELDALKRAYASGTLRVTYEGKTVQHGDQADLLSRIRVIEAELGDGATRTTRSFATFNRG